MIDELATIATHLQEMRKYAVDPVQWGDLLDWQRVYNWAHAKPAGKILGTSCTNSLCPLAEYLLEQTERYWSVGASIICQDGRGIRLNKPAWVKALIKLIDGPTREHGEIDEREVTREQFLEAMEKVK